MLALDKPQPLEGLVHFRLDVVHPVHARDEFEILADREIFPVAEALRHVADLALDAVRFSSQIVAQARALAIVGLQEAAQHADRRRLAAAVGTEETPDLSLGHLYVDVIDGNLAAEALGQATHVDGERAHGVLLSGAAAVSTGHTSTGTPGRNGSPDGARASALNTSRSRLPTL